MGDVMAPAVLRVIASRLDELMTEGYPDGTGPRTSHAVAKASHAYADEHGGPTISHQSVQNLRNGDNPNPSVNLLVALANVFQKDVTFFLTSAGEAPDGTRILTRIVKVLSMALPKDAVLATDEQVAEATAELGCPLPQEQIAQLRAGPWDETLREPLRALATRVGIRPMWADCFIYESVAALVEADLEKLKSMPASRARVLALRGAAEDLGDDELEVLESLLEVMSRDSRGKRNRL